MSLWTKVRNLAQAVVVVVGNWYLPGSSILTGRLVSKGAKEHLASDLGLVANMASGVAGAAAGNMANYAKTAQNLGIINSPAAGAAAPVSGATPAPSGLITPAPTSTPIPGAAPKPYFSTPAPTSAPIPPTAVGGVPPPTNPTAWDKIGTFLDKPGSVTSIGFGIQGVGAVMGGMGASAAAKVEKEKLDEQRRIRAQELANINAPWTDPVRSNRPTGLINTGVL